MWTIYKITNLLNKKSYIGQTNQKVEYRWNDHKNGKTSTENSPLKRAIEKYGWDNFSKEIIDTADTFEEAIEKEKYWIDYYKTCIPVYGDKWGYNLTRGGEGVFKITPEQEQLMLQLWHQKKNLTQIGKIMQIDRHTVQRTLIRMGVPEADFLQSKFYHYHPVYVYNLNGQLLNVFKTRAETIEAFPTIHSSQLDNVLMHRLASTHNLIFLYEDEIDQLQSHILRSHKQYRGQIRSINIKTGEVIIYDSITQAQNKTGINRHTIRNRIQKEIIKNDIKWEENI